MRVQKTWYFQTIHFLTLCSFLWLSVQGCVSIRVKDKPLTGVEEKPSITFNMYLKKPDKDKEKSVFSGVSSTLFFQNEQGEFVEVAQSRKGSWLLKNAPAGTYKVVLGDTITVQGKTEKLRGGRTETFTLAPDKRVELQALLKKTPVGWIVVISVLVVGLIILMIISNAKDLPDFGKILVPPLPKFGSNVPLPRAIPLPTHGFHLHSGVFIGPQPIFYDGGYYSASGYDEDTPVNENDLPPEAVSFFPQMNDQDVSPGTTILVYFSTVMDETSFSDARMIRVIGSESNVVQGTITFDKKEQKIEFFPNQAFVPGETVTVTLLGKLIRDAHGSVLAADYEWQFAISTETKGGGISGRDEPAGSSLEREEVVPEQELAPVN